MAAGSATLHATCSTFRTGIQSRSSALQYAPSASDSRADRHPGPSRDADSELGRKGVVERGEVGLEGGAAVGVKAGREHARGAVAGYERPPRRGAARLAVVRHAAFEPEIERAAEQLAHEIVLPHSNGDRGAGVGAGGM